MSRPEPASAQLAAAFGGVGLTPIVTIQWQEAEPPASTLYLVEVADFVETGDARLDEVRKASGRSLNRLLVLGGYAEPLGPEELGQAARQASAAAPSPAGVS